jgi:osmotically inducible protein OsmC
MIRRSTASWHGNGHDGKGTITSQSGVLNSTTFGYKSRFEDGPGTNPEELLAAAHAGCFTMATAFALQLAGSTPISLEAEAAVTLDPDGDGFKITSSALTLRGQVPGLDAQHFSAIASAAERNCPISKVLNANITLAATLVEEAVH